MSDDNSHAGVGLPCGWCEDAGALRAPVPMGDGDVEAIGRLGTAPLPVRARVYRSLKAAVLAGRWPAGERLTEERVASEMRASRTPVREALHRLEVEGVVTRLGRRGFAPPEASPAARDELLELKAVYEGHALRILCGRITPRALAALDAAVRRAETALARGNPREAFQWHRRFHACLSQGIGDRPRIAGELISIAQHLIRYRSSGLPSEETCARIARQHREILAALQLGDPEVCERLMREHGRGEASLACLPAATMGGTLGPERWADGAGWPWAPGAASPTPGHAGNGGSFRRGDGGLPPALGSPL